MNEQCMEVGSGKMPGGRSDETICLIKRRDWMGWSLKTGR